MINLVTGGTGFIGSKLIERLLSFGEKVICMDDLSIGSINQISKFKSDNNFKFLEHNVEKPIDIKVDKIWHFASLVAPKIYMEKPIKTLNTCFVGSKNMLELALKNKSKILLASSSEIYGNPLVKPQVENYFGNVNCFGDRACYSEGKRISETLFFEYKRIYNLEIRIARIFNCYGPGSSFVDKRVIPSFIRGIMLNSKIFINGDGSQTRSFCHITDVIKGLISLMNSNYSLPINIGNDEEISINDLAKITISKFNKFVEIENLDFFLNEPNSRNPSIKLAKSKLNWEPVIDLDNGLDSTIKYFSSKNKFFDRQ